MRLLLYALGIWLGAMTASFLESKYLALFLIATLVLTSRAREFQISIGAIAVGCAVLGIHAATLQHSALSELKDTKTPITITAIVTSEPH